MKTRKLMLAGLGMLLLWMLTAVAVSKDKEHVLKVGKKGEITLAQPTKVGDRELQPGTYVVQHRVSGGDHFIRFLELKQVVAGRSTKQSFTYTEKENAGEIKCRMEPTSARVKETTVYTFTENGVPRITKVTIKGEDVVHVF